MVYVPPSPGYNSRDNNNKTDLCDLLFYKNIIYKTFNNKFTRHLNRENLKLVIYVQYVKIISRNTCVL